MAAAGFALLEPPLPSKPPVHRPPGFRSAAEVKRALDRQRPSAARRGYGPRWRRARAAFLARHPLCAACRGPGARGAGDGGRPCRAAPWRPAAVLGRDATGRRRASPAMTPRPRARAAGADLSRPRGGPDLFTGTASGDRSGRRLFMPAKFSRGVSGRSCGGNAEFRSRRSTSIRQRFVRS